MKSVVHSSSFIPGSQSVHHFFARNCLYNSIFNFSISSLGFFGPESVYPLLVFSIEALHQMLRPHLSLFGRKSHRRAHYFLISADCFFHSFSLARVAPHINFQASGTDWPACTYACSKSIMPIRARGAAAAPKEGST